MLKNTVIYARFSSHTQTEQSIEGQLRECYEYAKRNGLNIVHEYIDRAISGTTDKRPEFLQMIEDSKKKQFEYVLVYQLDRFARNRYDSATYKNKLKKNGVRVLSAKENISDDASGILMEAVLEGMAEYYSSELGQKVKRGIKESMSKGFFIGGNVNLGYKIEDKRWVVDEKTKPIIEYIFTNYYNGIKGKEIADGLNELGYLNQRNHKFDCNMVSKIIRNTRYKGEIEYEGKLYTAIIPAIVDKTLWQVCNELMDNVRHRQSKGNPGNEHILSGKLICGNCGGLMTAESGRSKSGPVYYYYKCYERKMHRNTCEKNSLEKWIENLVIHLTKEHILQKDVLDEIANKVCDRFNSEITKGTKLKNLEDQLKDIDKALNEIVSAITHGIKSFTLQDSLSKLEKEKQELIEQILNERANQLEPLTPQIVKTFLKQYENVDFLSNKQKKEFFIKFINKVILYDNRIIIIYNTSKDPRKEVYYGDNSAGGQTLEKVELSPASGDFEDKNKDDSNTSSPSPQSVKNKKDCRDKCALQSIFGGKRIIQTELFLQNCNLVMSTTLMQI